MLQICSTDKEDPVSLSRDGACHGVSAVADGVSHDVDPSVSEETDEVVCLARVYRQDRKRRRGILCRWRRCTGGRRPHPAASRPPSGAAARPSLKTVHRTVFRALRAHNRGKAIRAAARPLQKTVHRTVFRALWAPKAGKAIRAAARPLLYRNWS